MVVSKVTTEGDELLRRAGELAVGRAEIEWARDIVDPPRQSLKDTTFDDDRRAIDSYIRSGVELGGVATPKTFVYRRDGDYEWCGAFAAAAWSPYIWAELRQLYWPSTYRLDCYGTYSAGFKTANAQRIAAKWPRAPTDPRKYLRLDANSTVAEVAAFGPRPGDILLVGTAPGLAHGSHVTLVTGWDPDTKIFSTIEGNATGAGPTGGRPRQGVVKQFRPLGTSTPKASYHALRLIRPGLSDLIPGSV